MGLKKIPDVAITKGLAHQFIFLLLVVKHGRNDIWLLCGPWTDGRKVERGKGRVMIEGHQLRNGTLAFLPWAGVATGHSRLGCVL